MGLSRDGKLSARKYLKRFPEKKQSKLITLKWGGSKVFAESFGTAPKRTFCQKFTGSSRKFS